VFCEELLDIGCPARVKEAVEAFVGFDFMENFERRGGGVGGRLRV